jgi:Glycosyl transferase family 2
MLVTAICPTADRDLYLPLALRCFARQTHEEKELVIVDNGAESVEGLLEGLFSRNTEGPKLIYYRLDPKQYGKLSHGNMMNACCELANGEVICAWDDDDWSCPQRMQSQIEALIKSGKSLTGYSEILYYDTRTGETFKYKYNGFDR